jgi:acetyltransferase (GNAT) family protein
MLLTDLVLARRLERAEAQSNVDFVEARARVFPDSRATWVDIAGAYAMFDGVSSPLTQTFGLGLFDAVTAAELERLEQFFAERAAPVCHEVSPLADPSLLPLLNSRQYQPIELTSVMCREINRDVTVSGPSNARLRVRPIEHDEHDLWAETAARGWSESPELSDFMLTLSQISAQRKHTVSFIAELSGRPIATGAMSLCDRVALLAGASTIPEGRKQGAQVGLLDARLRYAAEQGCDLAMMCAAPGSSSQRNAERQGFRIAYTRIKWKKS